MNGNDTKISEAAVEAAYKAIVSAGGRWSAREALEAALPHLIQPRDETPIDIGRGIRAPLWLLTAADEISSYMDCTLHGKWAVGGIQKRSATPYGWSFKVIDGQWAVSNHCCRLSTFLHAPSLHSVGCESRMNPDCSKVHPQPAEQVSVNEWTSFQTLEVGRTYQTRNGMEVDITAHSGDFGKPFKTSYGAKYRRDGRYYGNDESCQDLIKVRTEAVTAQGEGRANQAMLDAGLSALLSYRKSGGDYTTHPAHAVEVAINAALAARNPESIK